MHFQCVIQVCRHECPQPTCDSDTSPDFLGNSRQETSQQEGDKKFANRKGDLYLASSTHESSSRRTVLSTTTVSSQSSQLNQSEPSYGISATGGMPRALNLNKLRRKREVSKDSKTDVSTEKVIQVVAPGDVAFTLPLATANSPDGQSTEVVQRRVHYESGNVICMSTTGFAAGLVFLILLLLLTCIITVFLLVRLRNLPNTSSKEHVVSLQCPNHPNSPCSCEISLLQPQYYLHVPAIHLESSIS